MRVFVTGASGWIGSAVVPELIGAGYQVTGLARSDASVAALEAAGARVQRGSLDDPGCLRAAAAAPDGVIHLAFQHDLAFSGNFLAAADADRRAVEAFGEALAGTDRPFVLASGLLGLGQGKGRAATERDRPDPAGAAHQAAAHFGWLGAFITVDSPASAALTSELLSWAPVHPGWRPLIDDLEKGHYFR